MLPTLRETAGDREKKVNGQAQQEEQKGKIFYHTVLTKTKAIHWLFFSDEVVFVEVFENMEKHKH